MITDCIFKGRGTWGNVETRKTLKASGDVVDETLGMEISIQSQKSNQSNK